MSSSPFYTVSFTGPFGFIKPWTAVRDDQTYSQQFLTPSIVEGMRQKLEVSAIERHRITHRGFSQQQEVTQSAGYNKRVIKSRGEVTYKRPTSILTRGVMLHPVLTLAFPTMEDARAAHRQHLCLCRNEDVVYPSGDIQAMSVSEFDELRGFELKFGRGPDAFMVGYNRFEKGAAMYGTLTVTGDPVESTPVTP